MTLPTLKRVLCCACALGITWTASGKADAGFPFFHHAWYAPAPYTAYYGCGDCGYYGVSYAGYGLWGTNYVSYYAPSYYSYYTPSYYSTTSYYAPVYTTAYASYGVSCDPCAVTCCDPCGACGLAACYGCGFASACCPTDCPTGIASPPTGEFQPIPPYSGGDSSPSTYQPPAAGEQGPPARTDGTTGGGLDDGRGGSYGYPPDGGGTEIERGTYKPIERRQGAEPAEAEPSAPGATESDESETTEEPPPPNEGLRGPTAEDEEADVPPADIDTLLAVGTGPVRSRVRYTVRFVAPRVARMEITPHRSRPFGEAAPQLAATK